MVERNITSYQQVFQILKRHVLGDHSMQLRILK